MYRVIGADQKEYGPVSAEQLREWITQGRANARTLIQPEGTVGWKPLTDFPEFAASLAQVGPPAYPTSTSPPAVTDNNMAMASLILGCISLVCCQPAGVVGLILGIVALNEMKTNPAKGGRGLAIAGIATSIAALLFFGLMAAFGAFQEIAQKIFQK